MSLPEKGWQAARARIAAAERAAGRASNTVTLLAVSKTFPAQAVREVYALGQRAFGENYVQEAVAKQAALGELPGIEWRLIGPLQSNKAKLAAETFDWVESVDRLKVAERLAAARPAHRGRLNVLVQVNASGEAIEERRRPGGSGGAGTGREPAPGADAARHHGHPGADA